MALGTSVFLHEQQGYDATMYATGWHNGSEPGDPAGYGLKISAADRDRYFDRTWTSVMVDLGTNSTIEVPLSPSFWRSCTELRSADIGKWLLETNAAPWIRSSPPGIVLTPSEENRFTARLLVRRTLHS
jgi:hypothetical protein